VLAATSTVHADDTVAATAFKRAQELTSETPPRWAEACPLFEASYKADPQIGVLLYLADCHEHVGKTASAWAEFNDAADLAKRRGDNREGIARSRADTLAPKLVKLHLVAPPQMIDGLVVKRDGVDVTILVGADMPVDPGDHQIAASAPGYVTWQHKVTVTTGVEKLQLPALEKAPDKPLEVREGTLIVRSESDAVITVDSKPFGTGTGKGKLRAGGHTLRVVAAHMRPYQQEVQITADEERTIDVPLEGEITENVVVHDPTPSFELGVSLASGVKLRNENPIVLSARAELALRIGRRVNFGVFAEVGEIDTAKGCGFDIPGPDPSTPFDVGPRTQMTKCTYIMPGLQLYVHLKPKEKLDPYVGITPGFRFGFVRYTPSLDGHMSDPIYSVFPAIVTGVRAGVSYRASGTGPNAWIVGGYLEGAITIIGREAAKAFTTDAADSDRSFVTIFAGVRSTYMF
jgi:hypothetical protein